MTPRSRWSVDGPTCCTSLWVSTKHVEEHVPADEAGNAEQHDTMGNNEVGVDAGLASACTTAELFKVGPVVLTLGGHVEQ